MHQHTDLMGRPIVDRKPRPCFNNTKENAWYQMSTKVTRDGLTVELDLISTVSMGFFAYVLNKWVNFFGTLIDYSRAELSLNFPTFRLTAQAQPNDGSAPDLRNPRHPR